MRFFKRPLIGTVRKHFAWLPHRYRVVENDWVPVRGAALIPFAPGVLANGGITTAQLIGPSRAARQMQAMSGGMVAPVEYRSINTPDCWVWLEHYLEELEVTYRGDKPTVRWISIGHRKQWNLWHEYD